MGYTFIALQGFDLIAAVGGEVRDPERNIPRAMFWSLGIALLVYLPLLLIICTIGIPAGSSLADLSRSHPETVVAEAVRTYLGPFGFWLVIAAGLLSMLSALSANLFAASRVALSMAQDRSLPAPFGVISDKRGTPTNAVVVSVVTMIVTVIVLGDVATAGAASSLIFLMTFAVAHWICILMRRRGGAAFTRFRLRGTQCLPYVGGIACVGLAVFQGVAVPPAGMITGMWLLAGAALFFLILSRRARVVDASAISMDPQLLRLRGRSPLVLVPIANPANAQAMVIVANALTPPGMGRVLLLSVVAVPNGSTSEGVSHGIDQAQQVLQASLSASVIAGLRPEALTTVTNDIWEEIARVARVHRCEILLLGFSAVSERLMATHVEQLISSVRSDVVVLRSSPGWNLDHVERVLVPVGGRSSHRQLRARLLSSLYRSAPRQITYLRVVPEATSQRAFDNIQRELQRFAQDEVHAVSEALVIRSNDPLQTIIEHAKQSHLILLGLQRPGTEKRIFGNLPLTVAEQSDCAIIMIHQKATRRAERGSRSFGAKNNDPL
jgi:nucleotide-binding universal stress UspA family protein